MNGLSSGFQPLPGPMPRQVSRAQSRKIRQRLLRATGQDPYAAIADGTSRPVIVSQACLERLLELGEMLGDMELPAGRRRS